MHSYIHARVILEKEVYARLEAYSEFRSIFDVYALGDLDTLQSFCSILPDPEIRYQKTDIPWGLSPRELAIEYKKRFENGKGRVTKLKYNRYYDGSILNISHRRIGRMAAEEEKCSLKCCIS